MLERTWCIFIAKAFNKQSAARQYLKIVPKEESKEGANIFRSIGDVESFVI
jgi:hypothetical protein